VRFRSLTRFLDTSALGAFSDDDQVGPQIGRQPRDRLEQSQMILLARKTADNQNYVPVFINPQLVAERTRYRRLAEPPAPIPGMAL